MSNEESPVELPNEIWLYILQTLVQPRAYGWQEHTTFFPPGVDLTPLLELKNVSRRFRALASATELLMRDQLISMCRVGDIRRLSIPPQDLRHLEIRSSASTPDSWEFKAIFRPFVKLESLSIIFTSNTDILTSCLAILPLGKSLRRFHLTSQDTDLCHLDLDFPNLEELQLSRVDPRERNHDASSFIVETFADDLKRLRITSVLSWLSEGLKKSLIKLRRLRFLSLHISLAFCNQLDTVRRFHQETHGNCCLMKDCRMVRGCQAYETQKILLRERRASEEVARYLPELERIRWVDIWKVDSHNGGFQREYWIDRSNDGIILPVLSLEVTPSSLLQDVDKSRRIATQTQLT